jgi:hypothetical protein
MAKLGESCTCPSGGTFFFCTGPCDTGLTCVGSGKSGKCFGAQCCSGASECAASNQSQINAKCPSGQVCAVFDGAIGYCGPLP